MKEYMLPCLNKQLFGVECPGCGAQRATALFFDGQFLAAFKMYPAIYSLLLLAIFLLLNTFISFPYSKQIKYGLILLNVLVVVISYIIKMSPYI